MNWLFRLFQQFPVHKSRGLDISMIDRHNTLRSYYQLVELITSAELMQAALFHAKWMNNNRSLSHIGAMNSSHAIRARKFGYTGLVAENIAYGQSDESVFDMWVASLSHKRNILDKFIHIGYAKSGKYYCVLFGR